MKHEWKKHEKNLYGVKQSPTHSRYSYATIYYD